MADVWFITGVSSGLGLEMALAALEQGCRVIGTVRNKQRAAKEVVSIEEAGGKVLILDVTDAQACHQVFAEAEQTYGHIDFLVNNAGASYLGALEDFTDEEVRAQMSLCFEAPYRLIRAALPSYRRRRSGMFINISSVAGVDGIPASGVYAAIIVMVLDRYRFCFSVFSVRTW